MEELEECGECFGDGEVLCNDCDGTGTGTDEDGNEVECQTCDGTGNEQCMDCDGNGHF